MSISNSNEISEHCRKPSSAKARLHSGSVMGAGKLIAAPAISSRWSITASGIMAAYAEGLDVMRAANAGTQLREIDAETTPLCDPEHYQFDFNLTDVAEVWRRGSVIATWLLDLTAAALVEDPGLSKFAGRVSDSGEGRWTIKADIDEGVPTPVLTTALYERFSSRGDAAFQDKLLSAMRYVFGGQLENAAK